jgi:AH receptor-interacting protein
MDADEKLGSVPKLKEEGNQLFKAGKLEEAAQKYADAIGRLEQLMLRLDF